MFGDDDIARTGVRMLLVATLVCLSLGAGGTAAAAPADAGAVGGSDLASVDGDTVAPLAGFDCGPHGEPDLDEDPQDWYDFYCY